jgi:hypothetical protein
MSLNGSANVTPSGNGNGQAVGANLAFTKFLFVNPQRLDEAAATRLRTVGALIARGFFNDFHVEGESSSGMPVAKDQQRFETIQFLVQEASHPEATIDDSGWLARARYVVQVSSKYRPASRRLKRNFAVVSEMRPKCARSMARCVCRDTRARRCSST